MAPGRRLIPLLILSLLAPSAAPASAVAASKGPRKYLASKPAKQLKRLNRLRASIGSPRVKLRAPWSRACAQSARYAALNGGSTHYPKPGRRGYTKAGAWAAARSVLAYPPMNPFPAKKQLGVWGEAPYHQLQVLNPLLRKTGLAKGCMVTLGGWDQSGPAPEKPTLLTWPGNQSKGVLRTVDACNERPSDPFTDLGWSCYGVGPAIFIYAVNQSRNACFWSEGRPLVRLSDGKRNLPVEIATSQSGTCGWIALVGRKLRAKARHTLTVELDGASVTRRFKTGKL